MNSLVRNLESASSLAGSPCRQECGVETLDALLRECGVGIREETDHLLDLRWLLRRRESAETALALFCHLRRAMEAAHYLAFYRLRRWLEDQVLVDVQVCRGQLERPTALKLDCFCIEAVRSRCLSSVLAPGEPLLRPRVRFRFRAHAVSGGLGCENC